LTFIDILRHAAKHGLGVRIDDDVDAFIARTLPRRRSVPRKSFETDFVDGRWFWMDHTILPNGWVLSVGTDITALKHNEKSLRRAHEEALLASRTDLLTGLPNRRRILELLDEALAADRVESSGFCLAIIDLDQFKCINDTYGHDAGDAVLQHFADTCRERLREQDMLGRMGGEEFLLLLPDIRLNEAVRVIEKIQRRLPPAKPGGGAFEIGVTFSAGIAEALPQDDQNSLIRRADHALFEAKRHGRNCSRISFGTENRIPQLSILGECKRAPEN
jgi:diguanylate cyclase (GGDEF)-like protein